MQKKVREEVIKLSQDNCPACEVDDPSQLHHDCMVLDFVTIYTYILKRHCDL